MKNFPPQRPEARRLGFLASAFLAAGVLFVPALSAVESALPHFDRAAILARSAKEHAAWSSRIPKSHPRLFFTADQWAGLRDRFAHPDAVETVLLDEFWARVRKTLATPVPAYREPETFVKKGGDLQDPNQELWQRSVGDDIVLLSLALGLKDDEATKRGLRERVLTACGYKTWGRGITPNMDLSCSHLARGIAIAYDWHPDIWTDGERALILSTIRARAGQLNAAAYNTATFWAFKYTTNHNQVDMAGLGLCGLAFYGEIPEAGEWLATGLTDLEYTLRFLPADGSTVEGVPYWTYSLDFILQFLEGIRPSFGDSLYQSVALKHAIEYRLYASTPGFDATLPWGDAPIRDYYGPQSILYRLASQYRDRAGQWLANHIPFAPRGGGDVMAWTLLAYDRSVGEQAPRVLDWHYPINDEVSTRSGWDAGDYLLAIKSGYNNRNHCHLDAGAIAWSFGDEWLLTTPGYGGGASTKDFWNTLGPRWTYLSNATEAESTLLVDGHNQKFSRDARSTVTHFVSGPEWCWTHVDLTGVYDGVTEASRKVVHHRGEYALILDSVAAKSSIRVEWLAQVPPRAVHDGSAIRVPGDAGSITIRMVNPAASFALRKPTSLHLDVKSSRQETLSAWAEGPVVNFATLISPSFHGKASFEPSVRFRETAEGKEYQVSGHGWRDVIGTNLRDGPIALSAAGFVAAKAESSDNGVVAEASAIAVTFPSGGAASSVLAIGGRSLSALGIRLDLESPADFSIQRAPSGSLILDLATPMRGRLAAAPGWKLVRPESVEGATRIESRAAFDLGPGHYVLAAEPR